MAIVAFAPERPARRTHRKLRSLAKRTDAPETNNMRVVFVVN
jgi:hypothetical protein